MPGDDDGLTPAQRARERYLRRANIPGPLSKFTLDLLSGDVRSAVEDFVTECQAKGENLPGQGILLHGGPGRGKTTAAVTALRLVLETAPRGWLGRTPFEFDAYRPGYFAPYAELLRTYKRSWNNDEPGEKAMDLIESLFYSQPFRYRNTRVLVLDDVGNEHSGASGFSPKVLHDILRSRYAKSAPTIITTNLSLTPAKGQASSAFERAYGEATYSFVHEAFTPVEMSGKDWRRP